MIRAAVLAAGNISGLLWLDSRGIGTGVLITDGFGNVGYGTAGCGREGVQRITSNGGMAYMKY
jgi:hypothetical protein